MRSGVSWKSKKTVIPLRPKSRNLLSQLQGKEAAQQALAVQVKELGYSETAYKKAVNEVTELEKIQVRFNILGKKIVHGAALKTQVADLGTRILQKQGELAQLKALIDQSEYNPEIGARLEQTLTGIDDALRKLKPRSHGLPNASAIPKRRSGCLRRMRK